MFKIYKIISASYLSSNYTKEATLSTAIRHIKNPPRKYNKHAKICVVKHLYLYSFRNCCGKKIAYCVVATLKKGHPLASCDSC